MYLGDDMEHLLRLTYKKAMNQWALSDYVLAHSGANNVVNGAINCHTSYINDGFDKTNVYFSSNKDLRRMEVRIIGPLLPGKYEALINYDPPIHPSSYRNAYRRQKLSSATFARLKATYPARILTKRKAPWPAETTFDPWTHSFPSL
jgi:hypothetical protein